MAGKMSTVYEGLFLAALRKLYFEKFNTQEPFLRNVPTQVRIARKTLEKPELIEIIQQLDLTVLDVFEEAGIPFEISEEERSVLSALEKASAGKQKQLLAVIRNICDPWWVETLDAEAESAPNSVARFKQYALHKYAASAEKDISSPLLKSMLPQRRISKILTDIYPQFCAETGIPASFLMDLPMSKIRFYSKNANADRIFTEYKLIYSDDVRSIVKQVILKQGRE